MPDCKFKIFATRKPRGGEQLTVFIHPRRKQDWSVEIRLDGVLVNTEVSDEIGDFDINGVGGGDSVALTPKSDSSRGVLTFEVQGEHCGPTKKSVILGEDDIPTRPISGVPPTPTGPPTVPPSVTNQQLNFGVMSYNILGAGTTFWYSRARRPESAPEHQQLVHEIRTGFQFDVAGLQEVFLVAFTESTESMIRNAFRRTDTHTTFWARATGNPSPIKVGNMNIVRKQRFDVMSEATIVVNDPFLGMVGEIFGDTGRSAAYSELCPKWDNGSRVLAQDQNDIRIGFYNVHLTDVDGEERTVQAKRVKEDIEARKASLDHVILVGDLNITPSYKLYYEIVRWPIGLEDAGPSASVKTWGTRANRCIVNPGDRVPQRLDYIFYTPSNLRGRQTTLTQSEAGFRYYDRPVRDRRPGRSHSWHHLSDHFAVIAFLELKV